ncbi:MAG: TolC family protein [Pyrinomonadaceae bacterium]
MRNYPHFLVAIFIAISIGVTAAFAQVPTPSPSPTPSETPAPVDDSQNVKPEHLEGVPDIAPDYQKTGDDERELGRVGVDMLKQRPLSLRETVVMALDNNKDIEISRQDVKLSEYDYEASKGVFTPFFNGSSYFQRAQSPNASVFNSNPSVTNTSFVNEIGYTNFIPRYGTTFGASFHSSRTTTNNPISSLSPQYDSGIQFTINQPLFQGRKTDNGRRAIEIAKENLTLSDKQFRQTAIEVTVTAQRAYWDLAYALRNLQVQRDGVRDAKEQLEHNRRLVAEGALAPVDVLAAETQVANLEQNVWTALEGVNKAENVLKNLIAPDSADPLWNEAIVPTESVDVKKPNIELNDALQIAMDNRVEFDVLDVSQSLNEYDKKFYKDQLDPQINLTASYTSNGISGSTNPNMVNLFSNTSSTDKLNEVITRVNQIDPLSPPITLVPIVPPTGVPDTVTGGYFSSITDIFANRYPTFQVGVSFSFVTDKRAKQAMLGKTLVQEEKIATQREQLQQAVQVDVRNALQAIRTSEAQLTAASVSRRNSQEQYDSEKRKLDSGYSDIYKVLERQTALMAAKSAELRARTELNKAIADLQRATGNSLKDNNLETRLRK